jgi:hypothetical protein
MLAASTSGSWTVIGPSVANANPRSAFSRAATWVNCGHWMGSPPRGPSDNVPGHNSAYRREALLALGDGLEDCLEAGWQLQTELCARGGRLFLEPEACIEIVSASRPVRFVVRFFRLGRLVAAQRRRHWALTRRLGYAAGAPLIPLVRLSRIVGDALRRGPDHAQWQLLPWVVLALVASATGEMIGYLFGGGAPTKLTSARSQSDT